MGEDKDLSVMAYVDLRKLFPDKTVSLTQWYEVTYEHEVSSSASETLDDDTVVNAPIFSLIG